MVERILVPFTGSGSGTGPLTWGQQQLWRAMVEMDSSMGMGAVVPLPPGHKPEDTAEELKFFVSRYQAMRTRLQFSDDDRVQQVVSESGETWVDVVDAETDPEKAAEGILAGWRQRKYDYENEWPMRLAVVRHNAIATHVVVMLCHIAADAVGVGVMMRDLAARDRLGPPAIQPLELAQWQQSAVARRHTDGAMRYWETHLRAIPAQRFADYTDRGEPRFMQICWASKAMYLAMQAIAARDQFDTAPILLCAAAIGLGRVTGRSPFVAQNIVNNRFRPGLSDVVSPLNQNGLCVVDVAHLTIGEVMERARRASMNSSKHAYYDPQARDVLIESIERDRGERIDLSCFLNDRRLQSQPQPPVPPTGDEIVAAQRETAVLWTEPLRLFNEKLMVNFDDVPDTLQVTTEVDTGYLSVADTRAMLTEMESALVQAALDGPGVLVLLPQD